MNFRNKYVLAIDQGTTSSRAILFNHQGTLLRWLRSHSNSISRNRAG
jgi:glycerol kinase